MKRQKPLSQWTKPSVGISGEEYPGTWKNTESKAGLLQSEERAELRYAGKRELWSLVKRGMKRFAVLFFCAIPLFSHWCLHSVIHIATTHQLTCVYIIQISIHLPIIHPSPHPSLLSTAGIRNSNMADPAFISMELGMYINYLSYCCGKTPDKKRHNHEPHSSPGSYRQSLGQGGSFSSVM